MSVLLVCGWLIVVNFVCPDYLSELTNLLKTSDIEGVRRQARGALEVLGVAVETRPTSVARLTNFTSSLQLPAVTRANSEYWQW